MRNCRKLLNSWWTYYLFWAFITECHNREVVDSNRRISPISVGKVVLHVEIWIENLRIFPLSKLNECLSTLFSCYDSLDMQIGRCLSVIQLKQLIYIRNSYFIEEFCRKMRNNLYIPIMELHKYTTAYWEGQFKQWLIQTSLLVVGSHVVFLCYSIVTYSLKR